MAPAASGGTAVSAWMPASGAASPMVKLHLVSAQLPQTQSHANQATGTSAALSRRPHAAGIAFAAVCTLPVLLSGIASPRSSPAAWQHDCSMAPAQPHIYVWTARHFPSTTWTDQPPRGAPPLALAAWGPRLVDPKTGRDVKIQGWVAQTDSSHAVQPAVTDSCNQCHTCMAQHHSQWQE